MIRSQFAVAIGVAFCLSLSASRVATAQQLYMGSSAAELRYAGNGGIDANGRAINVDGRPIDRYGTAVDDYGWPARNYRYPNTTASGFYSSANYGGTTYSNGASPGGNSYGISPPRSVVVGGVIPSRTVMNNATRGTVIEYTHNGNGYISTPGSTYQTVISSGPSIFPYTSVVSPSQPPVVIESRPTAVVAKSFRGGATGRSSNQRPNNNAEIQLVCPKESTSPLIYLLNGTIYTIKPGYSQTFPDDRPWTIEFLRGGDGSPRVRYDLRAGIYRFMADENGCDLKLYPPVAQPEIPPSPAPPTLTESSPEPTPAPRPSPDF
jgi:hypothetical protein